MKNAENKGWVLCKDEAWLDGLLTGLTENKNRYNYPSCPCRLAEGTYEQDKDIICPCNYAPPDIEEHGMCFCGLFYSLNYDSSKPFEQIPERRQKSD